MQKNIAQIRVCKRRPIDRIFENALFFYVAATQENERHTVLLANYLH